MNLKKELTIPPMSARAFKVEKGEILRIVDVEGGQPGQPGDFVAFSLDNYYKRFGQARTRVGNGVYAITAGDNLWSMNNPPEIMFRLTKNTVGRHDLLYTPCCRYALKKRFNVSRDGCFENLENALSKWNIPSEILPDPLFFLSAQTETNYRIAINEHISSAGDIIEMKAEMNSLVAVSTCSVPISGKVNSQYKVKITSGL